MLTSEVLDKAADKIELNGWFKDTPGRRIYHPRRIPSSRNRCYFCAYTAITHVVVVIEPACAALAANIDPKYQGAMPASTVIAWNDAQPNKANVIRKLRAVAKKLREKGE